MSRILRLLRAADRALCRVGGACCISRSQAAWRETRDRV
jgi:hypothetical protein